MQARTTEKTMKRQEQEKRWNHMRWRAVLMGSAHETEDSISPLPGMQMMNYFNQDLPGGAPEKLL
jgi:hypothetical protein